MIYPFNALCMNPQDSQRVQKIAEFDNEAFDLDFPDKSGLFEFNNRVDGWDSPKITLFNCTINANGTLSVVNGSKITFNKSIPAQKLFGSLITNNITAGTLFTSDVSSVVNGFYASLAVTSQTPIKTTSPLAQNRQQYGTSHTFVCDSYITFGLTMTVYIIDIRKECFVPHKAHTGLAEPTFVHDARKYTGLFGDAYHNDLWKPSRIKERLEFLYSGTPRHTTSNVKELMQIVLGMYNKKIYINDMNCYRNYNGFMQTPATQGINLTGYFAILVSDEYVNKHLEEANIKAYNLVARLDNTLATKTLNINFGLTDITPDTSYIYGFIRIYVYQNITLNFVEQSQDFLYYLNIVAASPSLILNKIQLSKFKHIRRLNLDGLDDSNFDMLELQYLNDGTPYTAGANEFIITFSRFVNEIVDLSKIPFDRIQLSTNNPVPTEFGAPVIFGGRTVFFALYLGQVNFHRNVEFPAEITIRGTNNSSEVAQYIAYGQKLFEGSTVTYQHPAIVVDSVQSVINVGCNLPGGSMPAYVTYVRVGMTSATLTLYLNASGLKLGIPINGKDLLLAAASSTISTYTNQPMPVDFDTDGFNLYDYSAFKTIQLGSDSYDPRSTTILSDLGETLYSETNTKRLDIKFKNTVSDSQKITHVVKLPPFKKLSSIYLASYNRYDLSRLDLRNNDSNSFVSGSTYSLPYAYRYSNFVTTIKFPTAVPGSEDFNSAQSLVIAGRIANWYDVPIGTLLITQNIYFLYSDYSCIEYIKKVYDNYARFKPRPIGTGDTSDLAKTMSRSSTYLDATNYSRTSFPVLAKPTNYIQANATTIGNNGLVKPIGEEIIDCNVNFNAKAELTYTSTAVSDTCQLTINVTEGGQPAQNLQVVITEAWDYSQNNQAVLGINNMNNTNVYKMFGLVNENGSITFNFTPVGRYTLFIFDGTDLKRLYDTNSSMVDTGMKYSNFITVTAGTQTIDITLTPKVTVALSYNVTLDGVWQAFNSPQAFIGGYYFNSSSSLTYFEGTHALKVKVNFVSGGIPYYFVHEQNVTIQSGVQLNVQIDVLSTDFVQIYFGGFTYVKLDEDFSHNFTTNQNINLIKNREYWAHKGIYSSSSRISPIKIFVADTPKTISDGGRVKYTTVASPYNNENHYFNEGRFYNHGFMHYILYEDLGDGDGLAPAWYMGRFFQGIVFPRTITRMKVMPSLQLKIMSMLSQYQYILVNQKKDNSETLKYSWTITS